MESIIDHVLSGLALVFAAVASWLARRGVRLTRREQKLSDIVPKAVDAAIKHTKEGPNRGLDVRRVATEFAIHLDLEDGKADFTHAKLHAEVTAELQRRGI